MKFYLLLILALTLPCKTFSASYHLTPLNTKPVYTTLSPNAKYIFSCYEQTESYGSKTVQFICVDCVTQTTIGLIELHQKITKVTIERLYVHKDFRRQGIARILLSTALNYSSLAGKASVSGDIWPLDEDSEDIPALKKGQEKLIKFYQQVGARIIEQHPYLHYPGLIHYSFIFDLCTYKKN